MNDLLIVGGGPIGATLALLLRDSGIRYRVLDARPPDAHGAPDRTLALSYNARLLFERIGIWRLLDRVSAIEEIDVSQKGGFGMARLSARDVGVPALGYVIHYGELQRALDDALARSGVDIVFGQRVEHVRTSADEAVIEIADGADAQSARLIAIADGSGDVLPDLRRRKVDYRQRAVIGHVECDAPQRNVAFERFTSDGPVALLPDGGAYALVWTTTPERATLLRVQGDADFLAALQRHFGDRVGRFTTIRDRNAFPLSLQFASAVAGPRWVVLGNAAQALHPIAGQGFNLGLRDVWTLAQAINDVPGTDIGSAHCLDAYVRARRTDRWAGMLATHGLVGLFANDHPLLSGARGLGLTLLDAVPPLKRALTRAMQNGIR